MKLLQRLLSTAKAKPAPPDPWGLDAPLLYFSRHDPWTIRDATSGCAVFGATGSGKSSGSGRAIAMAFLRAGFGGLVLTVKPDERALWQRYCDQAGRGDSLLVFSPDQPHRFNFLDYELRRRGSGAGLTENLVSLFTSVLEIAERSHGSASSEQYWQRTARQLLRNAIDLLVMATGQVSLPDLYRLVTTAPHNHEDVADESWRTRSFCCQCLVAAHGRDKTPSRQADYDLTASYWLSEFPGLAEKTRSVIVSSFTSMADALLRGSIRDLFCTATDIVPELSQQGMVILLDLPIKEYGEVGQIAQALFKRVWQQATERRDTASNPRPLFLWVDEAQYFLSSYDMLYQTTARSARAATVYLTQSVSNYRSMFNPAKAKDETDALLANLATTIFHASDPVTASWGAELIAKTRQSKTQHSVTRVPTDDPLMHVLGSGDQTTHSASTSEQIEYQLLPHEFTTLRTGGPAAGFAVDAIVHQTGRIWRTTRTNYLPTVFSQRL